MQFAELARVSTAVAETSARSAKVELLAACLRTLRTAEVPVAVTFLTGSVARTRVGWASLRELPAAAEEPTLELLEVAASLDRLGAAAGPGSQRARKQELDELFGRATEPEQHLLRALLHGGLRQGALEGVMVEAVAKAAGVPPADVRRATMLAGGLDEVAHAALAEGSAGLARFGLELFRPVQPMLAQTAVGVDRGARARRGRGGRVEARRGARPGAPAGRRGARLHAQPRRGHRARPGGRRGGARVSRWNPSSSTAR